ncbi:MAG: bacteriohemerythrin [Desulfuromonadaceae bacterium]|nr:bacteriohemerythrin [Desulfuromonadaceae bacterium]
MTLFEWDNSIALGIPVIDEQHKMLFTLVNSLNAVINREYSSEVVGEVIWKLVTYVTEHFSEEERLMLSCAYPGLSAHRTEHDTFVTRLQEIQESFISGKEVGDDVLNFLVEWLVCHIKGTDQGYSRFIHEQVRAD